MNASSIGDCTRCAAPAATAWPAAGASPGAREKALEAGAAGEDLARHGPAPAKASVSGAADPRLGDRYDGSAEDTGATADERTRGVLRLLEAGHFRGVADVRLRINFFDEIAALESAALAPAAEEKVAALLDAVTAAVDALPEISGLSEEEKAAVAEIEAAFRAPVGGSLGAFVAAPTVDATALLAGIQDAFDALAGSLRALLEGASPAGGSPAVVAAEETADAPATEPTEPTGLDASLAGLSAAFTAALDDLAAALDGARLLPPLSEPNGNGAAYEKFLSMYEEMLGAGVSVNA